MESQEITVAPPQLAPPQAYSNPFAKAQSEHIAAGAVAIESERATAEAQGKLVIAKKFPRDPAKSFDRIMAACARPGLAAEAFWKYKRGADELTGPSIRLAEELARCWGNVEYGLKELSNREGLSEMEAYCWDMETNTSSKQQFTVRHLRDKRGGATELTEQRDIYEITANMGARRMRARILAILPADLVDAAIAACRKTLLGKDASEPIATRAKRMVDAFAAIGVAVKLLEERLGHPIAATTPEELVDLQAVYSSIKGGRGVVADFFTAKIATEPARQPDGAEALAILKGTTAAINADEPAKEKPKRAAAKKAEPAAAPAEAAPAPKMLPIEDKLPPENKPPTAAQATAAGNGDLF